MTAKKYLIDGNPVTAKELIVEACAWDDCFANDWLKETSVAANILRENGFRVEENPEAIKGA